MKQFLTRFFLSVFSMCSFFLFGSGVLASSEDNFNAEKSGTVALKIYAADGSFSASGTGVLLNDTFNIITNYHVVESVIEEEDTTIVVCFTYDEAKSPACVGVASVEKYDEEKDLALLNTYVHSDYLENEEIKPYYTQFLQNVRFEIEENISIAEKIYVFGYPGIGGETITYTSGEVSGFEDFYIKTDVKVSSGNSGGGAYNEKGDIIGLVTAVSGGEGNIGWIINGEEITNFLKNTIGDDSIDSHVCGDHQYKTELYGACKCEVGFRFDAMKKNCVPDLTYSGCGTMESNSFFNPQHSGCLCATGYEWEDPEAQGDYMCVEIPEYEYVDGGACSNGDNNYYNAEEESCMCADGFEWEDAASDTNYNCVVLVSGYCGDEGSNSFVNESDALCYCNDGYEWEDENSSDNFNCVKDIQVSQFFYDVPKDDINFDGVQYVKSNNIVNGYSDGSYRPNNKITRAEFTKIILLAKYSTQEIGRTEHAFIADVYDTDWYYDYVNFAKQEGVITGYADGKFRPNNEVTFAEAAKIVVNTFYGYRDIGSGEQWWAPFIIELEDNNISILELSYSVSRGDMATLIYQILK